MIYRKILDPPTIKVPMINVLFSTFSYQENELHNSMGNFGSELCVKLATDQWVVGKQVDKREVYIIVSTKNSNLIEIMAEVEKLISKEFKNICLLEK